MLKLPLKLNKSRRAEPCNVVIGVICGLLMSQSVWAATQGQWGSTSTATAKITLRIPAQHNVNNAVHESARFSTDGKSEAEHLVLAIQTIFNEADTSSSCQHWTDNIDQSMQRFAAENYQLRFLANNSQEHSLQHLLIEHCHHLNFSNPQAAANSLADPVATYSIKPAAKTTTTVLIAPL